MIGYIEVVTAPDESHHTEVDDSVEEDGEEQREEVEETTEGVKCVEGLGETPTADGDDVCEIEDGAENKGIEGHSEGKNEGRSC